MNDKVFVFHSRYIVTNISIEEYFLLYCIFDIQFNRIYYTKNVHNSLFK